MGNRIGIVETEQLNATFKSNLTFDESTQNLGPESQILKQINKTPSKSSTLALRADPDLSSLLAIAD
jgi:hypothetical protein